jgi:hypothetical protein
VLVRLARLPDPASQLARAVAVLGDDAPILDAAELAELDRGAAADGADALAAADVIVPGRPLRFVHPLVRGAVYADLPSAARATAHRQAAALLSGRGAEPERIAVHLLATDPAEDPTVVEALIAAARRALDRAAPETAIAYLRRALAERPAGDVRLDLLRLLVRASFRAGDRAGFEELLVSGVFDELTADTERPPAGQLPAPNWDRCGDRGAARSALQRPRPRPETTTSPCNSRGAFDLDTAAPGGGARGSIASRTGSSPTQRASGCTWRPSAVGPVYGRAAATVTLAQRAVKGGKIWGETLTHRCRGGPGSADDGRARRRRALLR